MIIDDKTFKDFWHNSLNPVINEIKIKYSATEVFEKYKSASAKTEYMDEVLGLLNDRSDVLNGKLSHHNGKPKMDGHKVAGLLLVVLLKRPLFYTDYEKKNVAAGFYFASILFAWKAALALLRDLILDTHSIPKDYAGYLQAHGLVMPSKQYEEETWRTLEMCFRDFHCKGFLCRISEPAPFNGLKSMSLACDEDWGWALVFANIFFLIEKNSFAIFELYKAWSNGSSLASIQPTP